MTEVEPVAVETPVMTSTGEARVLSTKCAVASPASGACAIPYGGVPVEIVTFWGVVPVKATDGGFAVNGLTLTVTSILTRNAGELLSPTKMVELPTATARTDRTEPDSDGTTFVVSPLSTNAYGGVPPEIVDDDESPV